MAVITVLTKDPAQFEFKALLHGVSVDSISPYVFEVIGELNRVESLAALTDSIIINSLDIKC